MDYQKAFETVFPGFFESPGIRSLPQEESSIEMALDLSRPLVPPPACPADVRFGLWRGELSPLHRAVAQVEEDWVRYFTPESRVLCAFFGDEPVSFCTLSEFGEFDSLPIAGPGCVGTIPAAREQGVGLRLVWEATRILKDEGFPLSWIHYTYLDKWYGKLGYQTVLRWNSRGFLPL